MVFLEIHQNGFEDNLADDLNIADAPHDPPATQKRNFADISKVACNLPNDCNMLFSPAISTKTMISPLQQLSPMSSYKPTMSPSVPHMNSFAHLKPPSSIFDDMRFKVEEEDKDVIQKGNQSITFTLFSTECWKVYGCYSDTHYALFWPSSPAVATRTKVCHISLICFQI